jgi:hypothetical protein
MTGPPGTTGPTTPPFPFVVGCGRSGTTLLRAMLDSHPDLAIPDEVSFVIRLARPHYARRYGWPRRFEPAVASEMVLANGSFRRWGLPEADVRAALAERPPASFPDLVRACYGLWSVAQDKPRYGDKTPMHVLHLRRLARMFPEARFVHVIRDGRDVATSYRSVPWGPSTVEDAAAEWRRRVRHGRRAGHALGPGRYREVRYEDLVADTEATMREVCRFIDAPWNESVLRYHERAEEIIGATRFPSAHQRIALPPTAGLRDWTQELSSQDVARFETIAGSLLDELGYERSGGRPSLVGRARGEAHVLMRNAARTGRQAVAGVRVLAGR